jgi:hypothetical protein
MKDKFFVIYERYTDFNIHEGQWELDYEEFDTIKSANGWIANSRRAQECRQYKRKLIGPLSLSV